MSSGDERNVVIEFLDGTNMKVGPVAWDHIVKTFNMRAEAVVVVDDRIETLVPLAAIKRVYRAVDVRDSV